MKSKVDVLENKSTVHPMALICQSVKCFARIMRLQMTTRADVGYPVRERTDVSPYDGARTRPLFLVLHDVKIVSKGCTDHE